MFVIPRQQREMEDSITNLGVVTTDKDVNDLAARHCEDTQVRNRIIFYLKVLPKRDQ